MTVWEHMLFDCTDLKPGGIEFELDSLSEERWELVSLVEREAVLRRPKRTRKAKPRKAKVLK